VKRVAVSPRGGIDLPSRSSRVVLVGDTMLRRGREMRMKPDQLFVLGDNRELSCDSRDFGAVQLKDVVGRVAFVIRRGRIQSVPAVGTLAIAHGVGLRQ
jgi:type IV secretory pathway protease TraF